MIEPDVESRRRKTAEPGDDDQHRRGGKERPEHQLPVGRRAPLARERDRDDVLECRAPRASQQGEIPVFSPDRAQ